MLFVYTYICVHVHVHVLAHVHFTHCTLEKEGLVKLSHQLDSIETDFSLIKSLLRQEQSTLIDLKNRLDPIKSFFTPFTSSKQSALISSATSNKPKSSEKEKSNQASEAQLLPSITPLSANEFTDLPSYLKGRLTISKINSFVTDFNSVLLQKYSLLTQTPNPAKLSPDQRQRFLHYQQQQSDFSLDLDHSNPTSANNFYFITDADLRSSSKITGFKYDQNTRNILSMLRQCGRIKEVRSTGIIRYVLV